MHRNSALAMWVTAAILLGAGIAIAQSGPSISELIEYDRRLAVEQKTVLPSAGVIPDAETAKSVALAVSIPVWGTDQIASELPLHAALKGNVWTVIGDPHLRDGKVGGELIVQLDKRDGRIISLLHTQ